jgi:hypothetical protein
VFLPLFECFLKRTFCDGTLFSYRIFLSLLYGLETTPFQRGFKFGKEENSAEVKSRELGGWGTMGVMFCQIIADEE